MARVRLNTNNSLHKPVKGADAIEALIELAKEGDDALAHWIGAGGDVNQVADPSNNITALHGLCRKGAVKADVEALDRLLRFGANPNALNRRGEAPLFRAVATAQWGHVVVLMQHGADWMQKNGRRQLSAWDEIGRQELKRTSDDSREVMARIRAFINQKYLQQALDETLPVASKGAPRRRPRL